MNQVNEATYVAQRLSLRRQLQLQRRRIAEQIDPPVVVQRDYPRSTIMRFLTRQPAVAALVVAKFAPLILGQRLLRSATIAIALGKVARSFLRGR